MFRAEPLVIRPKGNVLRFSKRVANKRGQFIHVHNPLHFRHDPIGAMTINMKPPPCRRRGRFSVKLYMGSRLGDFNNRLAAVMSGGGTKPLATMGVAIQGHRQRRYNQNFPLDRTPHG